ncbi:MAG TPA: immunoglobulin-like domain-containing protein [Clostridium sp.]
MKINITNNGSKQVYYELQYEVEKLENNKWIKVNFKEEPMFIEVAYILEPGKTDSQIVSLSNLGKLEAGKYRVVKSNGAWTAEYEIK